MVTWFDNAITSCTCLQVRSSKCHMQLRMHRIAGGEKVVRSRLGRLCRPWICCLREEEMESESTYTCLIIETFGNYLWKAIAAQASNRGTPNLDSKCEGFVASIEGPTYFRQFICTVLVRPIIPVIVCRSHGGGQHLLLVFLITIVLARHRDGGCSCNTVVACTATLSVLVEKEEKKKRNSECKSVTSEFILGK